MDPTDRTKPPFEPYREPVRTTLVRTFAIAAGVGLALARRYGGGSRGWAAASLVALWPALGGHFVELAFLNVLRPRLPRARGVQIAARLLVWFIGGTILALGMWLTSLALGFHFMRWHTCWFGGIVFIGIELIVHVFLQAFGRPSFYNGRG